MAVFSLGIVAGLVIAGYLLRESGSEPGVETTGPSTGLHQVACDPTPAGPGYVDSMRTEQEMGDRRRVTAGLAALVVSLAGVVTFGSIVASVGEWVEGRDLSVVLPWALPALVASALAAAASVVAVRRRRATSLAMLAAAVVAVALVALVLVNPSISHPVP